MSTWISDKVRALLRAWFRPGFRPGFQGAAPGRAIRPALLGLVLPLAGCFGQDTGALGFLASGNEEMARDVLRKVSLYEGDVVVRGPGGYCIDRRTLRKRADGGFALLASCETLSGLRGQDVEPVVMTVSVMPDTPGATRPGADQIAALMAPAEVLARHETADVAMVQFASGGDGVLPNGDPRHWRGGMRLNGHVIGLALYARKGSALAGKDGRALMADLARTIRRSSPERAPE